MLFSGKGRYINAAPTVRGIILCWKLVQEAYQTSCLEEEREARSRESRSQGPHVPGYNSQWVESIAFSAKETMPNVWELVPPSTWPLSWST